MALKILRIVCCALLVFSVGACSTLDTSDEEALIDPGNDQVETAADLEVAEDTEAVDEDDFSEDELTEDDTGEDETEQQAFDQEDTDENDLVDDEGVEEIAEEPTLIDKTETNQNALTVEEQPTSTAVTAPKEARFVNLEKIEYLSNDRGGTVVIKGSDRASYVTRVNPDTNQFIVEISNSSLPQKLRRPYILKDFGGEFAAINAYQAQGSKVSRVVIQMRNGGEPKVLQDGNSLIIVPPQRENVVAATAEEVKAEDFKEENMDQSREANAGMRWTPREDNSGVNKKVLVARTLDEFLLGDTKFYGQPLSIQMQDTDIRDALSYIATQSGINIVISDDVKGRLTIKLREVPWDQALVTIMRSKNLGYVRQGSVLRVSTLEKLREETDAASKIIALQKNLVPLKVKVFPVSYAKVADLAKQLQPFLSSGRGKVVQDNRSSTIIVTDTDEVVERVSILIKELDVAPDQVMIEAKIIEASEEFKRQIGVNWSLSGTDVTLNSNGGNNGGPVVFHPNLNIAAVDQDVARAAAGSFGFTLGVLEGFGTIAPTLALAQTDNLVKIISSPRVVTTNKVKAKISQEGQAIAITTTVNAAGVTSTAVERTPVELALEVTPQITAQGSVIMDVTLKRQFVGPVEDPRTLARAVNTREANTQVLVKNGQTAVIGGVFQSDDTKSVKGVPGLKNIPFLGWLFKGEIQERVKNELMIFLTPRILKRLQTRDTVEQEAG